jgi:hypothetical protein
MRIWLEGARTLREMQRANAKSKCHIMDDLANDAF